jgi:hypothetical protein
MARPTCRSGRLGSCSDVVAARAAANPRAAPRIAADVSASSGASARDAKAKNQAERNEENAFFSFALL